MVQPVATEVDAEGAPARPSGTPAHRRSRPARRHRPLPGATLAVAAAVVLAVLCGLLVRAWLLTHLALNSDEAVVGLMGRGIDAGHFPAFYWGQQYGGGESYVVAAVLAVVNGGPLGLNGTAAAMAAVASVLVWAVVREAGADGPVAAAAGGLAWVWSYAALWNSVRENGFRQVAICCGLLLVLAALRVHRRRAGPGTTVLLGLAGGVGWWASPEILYFALPVAVLLAASWERLWRRGGPPVRLRPGPVLLAAGAAVVGALPWIVANVGSGFASLRVGSLPSTPGQGYGYRLAVFFRAMLPMQLGARTVPGGAWVGGPVLGPVLFALASGLVLVALGAALIRARRRRSAAPQLAAALGVLGLPFLYAAVPSSGYWVDGRYGVYVPILVAVLLGLAAGGGRLRHWRGAPADVAAAGTAVGTAAGTTTAGTIGRRAGARWAAAAVVLGATVLTVAGARTGGVPLRPSAYARAWGGVDAPARAVDAALVRHHLTHAYATYWVAYTLDFLAPGRVAVSPSPLDVVRWPAMAHRVAAAPQPAWLFAAPDRAPAAAAAFSNPEPGPGGYTQADFTGLLAARHIPYRVVPLGVLDAVVPSRPVTLPAPG